MYTQSQKYRLLSLKLKTLTHPIRISLLNALDHEEKKFVGELSAEIGIEQAIISQHLAALRKAKWIIPHSDKKFVFYSIHTAELLKIINFCRQFEGLDRIETIEEPITSVLSAHFIPLINCEKRIKAIENKHRIHIINALRGRRWNVSQIMSHLQCGQSILSQHLRIMKDHHWVYHQKEGSSVFYTLNEDQIDQLDTLIEEFII